MLERELTITAAADEHRSQVIRQMLPQPDMNKAIQFFDCSLMPASSCASVLFGPLLSNVVKKCMCEESGIEAGRGFAEICPDLYCCAAAIVLAYSDVPRIGRSPLG